MLALCVIMYFLAKVGPLPRCCEKETGHDRHAVHRFIAASDVASILLPIDLTRLDELLDSLGLNLDEKKS